MKVKYILLIVLSFVLMPLFWSCKDDKPKGIEKEIILPKFELSNKFVNILVDKSEIVDIKQGEGDYKAFSLNDNIAKAEITDNKVKITGLSSGETAIIVSDKQSRYLQIKVISYYDKITADKEALDLQMRLGETKTETIKILKGNNGYVVTSENEDIATVTINNSTISVTGKKSGETKLTLKDAKGLEKTFTVKVATTTIPYTEKELEEIKAQIATCYIFNNDNPFKHGYEHTDIEYYNTVEEGMNFYGWAFYEDHYLKIKFSGDKNIGKKENALLSYYFWDSWNTYEDQPANFEIVKNDGILIWAIYSFVADDKLNYGYFIQKINP
ncbi:MAG: pilus assembly protein N-terminal domain-containing protein [Bacteroidia bacterium]|nr:pilus assembly protein N-terminal domain-containing protein [Bacteroidia bacterium]